MLPKNGCQRTPLEQLPSQLEYKSVILFHCIPVYHATHGVHQINQKRQIIPHSFTEKFIIDVILFILNNNFHFHVLLYHQLKGTGMVANFASLPFRRNMVN